jgi:hypothetical protein
MSEESEIARLQAYFRVLREQMANCSIPSRVHDEVFVIADAAFDFANPVEFLLKFGILFFSLLTAARSISLSFRKRYLRVNPE